MNHSNEHAKQRVVERYSGHNLGKLLRKIRDGEAKFVLHGHFGRLIYDVPTNINGKDVVIRMVVNAEKTAVISVLPPEFRSEKINRNAKAVKRAFFKHFEDEEPVASF